MRWCILLGLVALSLSTPADQEQQSSESSFLNTTMFAEDAHHHQQQVDEVEATTDDLPYEDEYLDDDESEFLPDPEALIDGEEEEEEVVVLDAESRIVAEQLIQELDHISNKLQDDEETVGTSRAITSAEVKKLERLLESAGLSPTSPLLQNLMQQNQDAVPASSLGSSKTGMTGLGSLLGGTSPVGSGSTSSGSGSLFAPGAMTKKNVEEIKVELKHMLFGPENQVSLTSFFSWPQPANLLLLSLFIFIVIICWVSFITSCVCVNAASIHGHSFLTQNQRRRQGTSGARRPISTSTQLHYSDTAARRPITTASSAVRTSRPQQKSGSRKRPRPTSAKAQNRQQFPTGQQSKRPPIPLFLRPPRPARPGVQPQHAKTVPTGGIQQPGGAAVTVGGEMTAVQSDLFSRRLHCCQTAVITLKMYSGRPILNEIARQPINEFRPPASDFRLPEPPFRQQIANTNFATPSRTASNNGIYSFLSSYSHHVVDCCNTQTRICLSLAVYIRREICGRLHFGWLISNYAPVITGRPSVIR